MKGNPTQRKIKDLKVKLENLGVEVRAILDKGKSEPGIIDAISNDISDFTDEIVKVKKQLMDLGVKVNENTKLTELYKEVKLENIRVLSKEEMNQVKENDGSSISEFEKYENYISDKINEGGLSKPQLLKIHKNLIDMKRSARLIELAFLQDF